MPLIPDKSKKGVFINPDTGDFTDELGSPISADQYKKAPAAGGSSVLDWLAAHSFGAGVSPNGPQPLNGLPAYGSIEQVKQLPAQAKQGAKTIGPMILPTAGSIALGTPAAALGSAGGPFGALGLGATGAAVGAGLGEGANQGLINLYNILTGKPTVPLNKAEIGTQAAFGAGGEILGQGIGYGLRGLGALKPGIRELSENVGQTLSEITNPPVIKPVGGAAINVNKLTMGTPAMENAQLAAANKPSMDILTSLKPKVPNAALHAGDAHSPEEAAAIEQAILDALEPGQEIQKGIKEYIQEGVDKKALLDKLKNLKKFDELSDAEIEEMAKNPDTYEDIIGSLQRRINAGKASGPSFEDLLNNSERNLIFKQEMALKRRGLLPREEMGKLADIQSELGDLKSAMKQSARMQKANPKLPLGPWAPQQYEARGAEMLGRVPAQGANAATQMLINRLSSGDSKGK